jgi:diguanylate cyclase (GGDEF)-like protein
LIEWLLDHIIHEDLALNACQQQTTPKTTPFTNWINRHFSLFERARMVIVLPLVFLIISAVYISFHLFQRYEILDHTEKIAKSVLLLYNVINALQIERGLSSSYLTQTRTTFKPMLLEQYRHTDNAIENGLNYKPVISDFTSTQNGMRLYTSLRNVRNEVLHRTISRDESNRYYTEFIRTLIEMIRSINYVSQKGVHSSAYVSLMLLIELSESVGLIRNEAAFVLENDDANRTYLRHLEEKRKTIRTLFEHVAEPDLLKRYEDSKNDRHVGRFEARLDPILTKDISNSIDPKEWFSFSTAYIDHMKHLIQSTLEAMYRQARENKQNAIWLFGLLWAGMLLFISAITIFSQTLKKSILKPIEEVTEALQRMAKGDKSYFHTTSVNDPILDNMVNAFNTLRQSLIKADYVETLIEIQSLKTKNFERLASRDPLTGIPNKRALDVTFDKLFKALTKERRVLSICVLDIDHFKRINDTYGHEAGDEVLRRFALTVKNSIRNNDFFARYGGEEFIVLLPDTSLNDACHVATKIKHMISTMNLNEIDANLHITVSIGVASTQERHFVDTHHLFKLADARLYEAKNKGRNRILPETCTSIASSSR